MVGAGYRQALVDPLLSFSQRAPLSGLHPSASTHVALGSALSGPPGLSLTGVRWVAPTTFRTLPLCTCCRDNSGTATGSTASLMRPVMSALPDRVFWSPVHRPFRGLLGR